MLNLVSAVGFAGFVLLALAVLHAERRRPGALAGRRTAFLAYAVALSFGAGLTGHDAWPFSDWPLAAGRVEPVVTSSRIVAVDTAGREHEIDARVWEPLLYDELSPWVHLRLPTLRPQDRDEALRFLLDHVERARQRARAGRGVGYFDRFLGPLAAPSFVLHPRPWPETLDALPFVALRVYHESWNVRARAADPTAFARTLVREYPKASASP